jgi:hypothetical protein
VWANSCRERSEIRAPAFRPHGRRAAAMSDLVLEPRSGVRTPSPAFQPAVGTPPPQTPTRKAGRSNPPRARRFHPKKGTLEMVAVLRDSGEWAIPGGAAAPTQDCANALLPCVPRITRHRLLILGLTGSNRRRRYELLDGARGCSGENGGR